jgi:hypothetical protein
MYKGRPLVRNGNTIYYGYMDEPVVVILQIMSTTEIRGEEVAEKINLQLFRTDPTIIKMKEKIVKKAERTGLFDALDVGSVWLERELKAAK